MTELPTERYFVTVERHKDKRGIFVHKSGTPFGKDDGPHTFEEMWDILDIFYMVLAPESHLLTIEEAEQYNWFFPLAEYTSQYGIARKGSDVDAEIDQAKGE